MLGLRWFARKPPPWPRRIDLALQGGGSHGAFTWGVLDRLLEDGGLDIRAISGTSAGALNAGVLVTGFARGGRDGARQALREFWLDVSRAAQSFSPFSPAQAAAQSDAFNFEQLPAYQWLSSFFRSFSPYQFNPLNLNPLRDVARRHVDEQALKRSRSRCSSPRPASIPASRASSVPSSYRPTRCSPAPACRSSSRRSKSTANPTGTAGTPAIRRCSRLSTAPPNSTSCW